MEDKESERKAAGQHKRKETEGRSLLIALLRDFIMS